MFYNTLRVSKFQTALVLKLSLNRFFCYQISFKALINIFTCYLSLKTAWQSAVNDMCTIMFRKHVQYIKNEIYRALGRRNQYFIQVIVIEYSVSSKIFFGQIKRMDSFHHWGCGVSAFLGCNHFNPLRDFSSVKIITLTEVSP